MCLDLSSKSVIQYEIRDLTLYKGHKMDYRLYFILTPQEKRIGEFVDGFARVASQKYDKTMTNSSLNDLRKSIFTNTHEIINKDTLKNKKFFFKTFEESSEYISKYYNFSFFEKITEVKKIIKKLIKESQLNISFNSGAQLFAFDFGITKTGRIYFFEGNSIPAMNDLNLEEKKNIYIKVINKFGKILEQRYWNANKRWLKISNANYNNNEEIDRKFFENNYIYEDKINDYFVNKIDL